MKLTCILSLLAATLIVGCASIPMANTNEDKSAKELRAEPEKAIVYIFREHNFSGYGIAFPVAVENKILGWLVHDSYLKITLEPGRHAFSTLGVLNTFKGFIGGTPSTINMVVEKNQIYFIKLEISGFPNKAQLSYVQPANAASTLNPLHLTRFDSRSLSLVGLSQHDWSTPSQTAPPTAQPPQPATGDQLNKFLEVLGAVLLISVVLFAGVEAAHTNTPPSYIPPPMNIQTEIVQKASAQPQNPLTSRTLITTDGNIVRVSGNNISSPTLGTSWTINGNAIHGTDGSSYHISDNGRVYSSDGRAYTVSGANLLGDDGSLCSITGTLINCR